MISAVTPPSAIITGSNGTTPTLHPAAGQLQLLGAAPPYQHVSQITPPAPSNAMICFSSATITSSGMGAVWEPINGATVQAVPSKTFDDQIWWQVPPLDTVAS
jgi:hypothetical protein